MGEVVAKRAVGRLRRYFGPEFAKGSCQTACQSLKRPVVPRGGESLCAFLNARGGQVLFGGGRDSQAAGQSVSDATMQDVAQLIRRFEPPAPVEIERVPLSSGQEILIFRASDNGEAMPFTYDGRAYQRIGTTTSVMPQETYQRLRHRGGTIGSSRLGSGGGFSRTARTPGQWTDTQCGCCGFWTAISPGLPQCQLRLARFRGLDKAEFNNQRQVHEHALQLMSEAMDFLSRHLPLAGRIEPGVFERVDEPLFPPVALREALVNTFCHRDYSHGGGRGERRRL